MRGNPFIQGENRAGRTVPALTRSKSILKWFWLICLLSGCSTKMAFRAGGAGSAPSAKQSQEPGKPSDESEGVDGYLTDPPGITTSEVYTTHQVTVTAPGGAVATDSGTPDQVLVTVWGVSAAALSETPPPSSSTVSIAGTLLGSIHPQRDGSFTISVASPEPELLVLSAVSSTDHLGVTETPSSKPGAAYQDLFAGSSSFSALQLSQLPMFSPPPASSLTLAGTWRPLPSAGSGSGGFASISSLWMGTTLITNNDHQPMAFDPLTGAWSTADLPVGFEGLTEGFSIQGFDGLIGGKALYFNSNQPGAGEAGGIFDPATNKTTAISTVSNASGRAGAAQALAGTDFLFWGGTPTDDSGTLSNSGWILDTSTNAWHATSSTNAPPATTDASAVGIGSKFFVWGGTTIASSPQTPSNQGYIYDPVADTWTNASTTNAPAGALNYWLVLAWTGEKVLVLGRQDAATGAPDSAAGGCSVTGGTYDPATDQWAPLTVTNSQTPDLCAPTSAGLAGVWTGSRLLLVDYSTVQPDYFSMYSYDPASDTWQTTMLPSKGITKTLQSLSVQWTGDRAIVIGVYSGGPIGAPLFGAAFFPSGSSLTGENLWNSD